MGKVASCHELSRQNSDRRQSSLVKRQRVKAKTLCSVQQVITRSCEVEQIENEVLWDCLAELTKLTARQCACPVQSYSLESQPVDLPLYQGVVDSLDPCP